MFKTLLHCLESEQVAEFPNYRKDLIKLAREIAQMRKVAAAAFGDADALVVMVKKIFSTTTNIRTVNDIGMSPLVMAWKKYLDASFTLFGRSSGRTSPVVIQNID